MKNKFANFLVWILNKMDVSIVIGCKVDGSITMGYNEQFFYKNNFSNTKLFYNDGQEFTLPEGKFTLMSELNDEGEYETFYTKIVKKRNK